MITKSGFTLWRITLVAFFLWSFTCCFFDNSDSNKGEIANRDFVPLNIGDTWKYYVTSNRQSHGNLLNEIDTGYRFIHIQTIVNNLAADTVKILLKDSVYFRDGTYAGVRKFIDTPIVQVAYITCYKASRESIYVKVDSGSYIVGDGQNRMILANLFTEGIPESQKKDSVIQNFNRKIVDTS